MYCLICMGILVAYMTAPPVSAYKEEILNLLGLELQTVVGCCMGAGK